MKHLRAKRERKKIFFCKLNIEDDNVFYTQTHTHIYIYIYIYIYNNNKNIYILIYKKSFKKCIHLFHKTFSNLLEGTLFDV